MKRLAFTVLGALASAVAVSSSPGSAHAADHPYIVFRDEGGVFASKTSSPTALGKKTQDAFAAAQIDLPEVISVWTTFSMRGDDYATYIVPEANDVEGINIPVEASSKPPLRSILYHNNVLELAKRAAIERAPVEGFAQYLFLLELMHNWGPEIDVPAPSPKDLIGFDYHWSFFTSGHSPAGGNEWHDNGDGTFTVVPTTPSALAYTPIDLYLMGLVPKEEVPPFTVLTGAVVPATPTDPLWGGAFAPHSFPWFDTVNPPLTVTATQRTVTIDDVIEANGERSPAAGTKTSLTLGIALVVPVDATDEDIAHAEAVFDPVAASLAPAFHTATGERGTLEVNTHSSDGGAGGAGGAGGSGATNASSSATGGSGKKGDDGGCSVGLGGEDGMMGMAAVGLVAVMAARLRRRALG